ncbi:MAG: DUF120 domain-containing protein [Candidatus Thermoplasmatota archaeon]|jgi:riboflavin kinase|nr:DUF120 domain-containing protein [Candidatus Thermoplasmatota archaeon]MCL5791193.1 DUF120 domain-containing protein [Candidatus Thermoplasmatota archaeon]
MVQIDKENDRKYFFFLSSLAEAKKENGEIRVSTSDLGGMWDVSQQSASRFIIEMEKEGLIKRRITSKCQEITIEEKGMDMLYDVYGLLSEILENERRIEVVGKVKSGLGEGRYYVSKKPYVTQFTEKLGIVPFPGTLNIKINPEYEGTLRQIRGRRGILIEGFSSDDRTYGAVKAFRCTIMGIKCALIFPYRSIYRDVMEIISSEYLRDKLDLKDDDSVKVEFSFKR